jgi:hypothetical protein
MAPILEILIQGSDAINRPDFGREKILKLIGSSLATSEQREAQDDLITRWPDLPMTRSPDHPIFKTSHTRCDRRPSPCTEICAILDLNCVRYPGAC